ncbi:PaaI family thioesterase [Pelosinus baikalensis]|uniref:Acyl-coenzyme A thioesterase THEM4 n=1 Tax=Pelosinus baikalensis TaxID=2892015 RepID=A0ABS8HXI5_9FIRM|nr:PaaI family thioesterase [Pelosinus baikalensis]MCC5467887.1 PaaI family thioesterase [Pelosinus baikalensis]
MELKDQWCFACGKDNPIGLKLEFVEEEDTYRTTFTAKPEHQGYDGIMHGGLVSTLLDEVMARYINMKGFNAVTARLEVRFRQPTPLGQQLTVRAKIISQRGKLYEIKSELSLPDGTVTAEGKATIAVVEDTAS